MNTKKPTVRTRIAPRGTHMGLEMMMIGVQMTRPRTVAVTEETMRRLKCRMKVYINATRVDHLVKISVRGVYICL
ncbi:hypothetical protein TB2_041171 [Malus domestica]